MGWQPATKKDISWRSHRYYDALNTTDPTQTLRKPKVQDSGGCVPGIDGVKGQCGPGGIRDYNFCAGLALLWLRGGE